MKGRRLWMVVLLAALSMTLLSGCLDEIRSGLPCRAPKIVDADDVLGTWQLEYSDFHNAYGDFVPGSEAISGLEEITLLSDNTYTQTFHSPDFEYEHSGSRWELRDHPTEGPKLVMYDLVYFAHGLTLTKGPLELFPQQADLIRYQELRSETGIRSDKLTVNYPEDGFVFLYPRVCLGKFSLLQMTSSWGDPDAIAVDNPVFTRVR